MCGCLVGDRINQINYPYVKHIYCKATHYAAILTKRLSSYPQQVYRATIGCNDNGNDDNHNEKKMYCHQVYQLQQK